MLGEGIRTATRRLKQLNDTDERSRLCRAPIANYTQYLFMQSRHDIDTDRGNGNDKQIIKNK